ncbi:MAG: DUF2254 domain-containing protein [Deltaproteobacteria bacterium]|nr:DUF2254 domain-containing protein [Deltaproteobacteria bacterium]
MTAHGSDRPRSALGAWAYPFVLLTGGVTSLFGLSYLFDRALNPGGPGLVRLLFHPDPASGLQTLSNLGEVGAAVLGVAITVVSIVVELASNRYTHRITELFIKDPVNFLVSGLFVVSALMGILQSLLYESSFTPYVGTTVSVVLMTLSLLALLPYFAYVFHFVSPLNIVDRMRRHTLSVVREPMQRGIASSQIEAVRGVEQLADVAVNAMENRDKGISMASVEALRMLGVDYQLIAHTLPKEWFEVRSFLAHNPDFVSMTPESLEDISHRRVWVEMKILRQYQMIYNAALNRMRDINYLVAINTRLLGESAHTERDDEVHHVVVKFFNTYLRATVNAHDVRTAYNVLNQYRLLAEGELRRGRGDRAVVIANHFVYYGQLAFGAKLPFILETVAYDLCALNELAYEVGSSSRGPLLRAFLQVDKEGEHEVQEAALRGVRKAQVKLATYYLMRGDERAAREVFEDMRGERPERLGSIRDEMLGVESKDFWEVIDRGENFDYLSPEQKRYLLAFFDWFPDLAPPRASVVLPAEASMETTRSDPGPQSASS